MHHARARVAFNAGRSCRSSCLKLQSKPSSVSEYSPYPSPSAAASPPPRPRATTTRGVHQTHPARAGAHLTSHTYQYVANRPHRPELSSSSVASSPSWSTPIHSMQPLPWPPIASPAAASVVSASHPIAFDIFLRLRWS
jgi:hypothetical protein